MTTPTLARVWPPLTCADAGSSEEVAVDLYEVHQDKIAECDRAIETALDRLGADRSQPETSLPAKRHAKGRNGPRFDARRALYRLLGADLSRSMDSGRTPSCG